MPSFRFYDENSQALQEVNVVTRDSLGVLAVHLLETRHDLSKVNRGQYDDLVRDLMDIVSDLHASYQRVHG